MRGFRLSGTAYLFLAALVVAAQAQAAGPTAAAASVDPMRPGVLYLQAVPQPIETAQLPNLLVERAAAFDAHQRYVIQLDGPITPQRRVALEQAGVQLGDYLPNFSYIADLSATTPAALASLGFVVWTGPYAAEWKISPLIGRRPIPYHSPQRQALFERGQVVLDVSLFNGMDANAALASMEAIAGLRIQRVDAFPDGDVEVTVTMPLDRVAELAAIDAVQFVEEAPDVTLRNNSNRWIVQSNQNGVTPLYDAGIHGEGQVVGVLDGRVDVNHCSFYDPNHPIGPTHRKIIAYNTSQGADLHGTHVAGTAVGDAGSFNNTRGVAYLAKMTYNTIPSFTDSGVYNALSTHHNQGARLHTNSWGNDGTTAYDGLARGIDRFSHDFEESLVMLAVTNLSTLKNPENAKNLLAVGASQDAPNQHQHCSGGTGPTADGRRKPEIYAPGCGTQSSYAGTSCSTTSLTGTSMACPAIAGSAALVRQYYVDGFYPSGAANPADSFVPSGALIKATLLNSAVDMTGISGYPSNLEGWGRVLLDEALHFSGETRTMFVADVWNGQGLSTGQSTDYTITVTDSAEKLKVTLVWTDPPAAAGSGSPSINNLDLVVIDPSSTTYLGNVFSGGVSVPGGSADTLNNVEQVHVASPALGTWTLRVVATAVNQGPQGYAIVASGAIQIQQPAFDINFPNGRPDYIQPDVTTSLDVEIIPVTENVVAADLVYRISGGSFVNDPLTYVSGNIYQATLPAIDCNDVLEYYISVDGDGGTTQTEPPDAPSTLFVSNPGTVTVVLSDDMETDTGWTVGDPNDDATTGIWNRMDPEQTQNGSGQVAQPEDDHTPTGTMCWVTDGNAGGSLGANDVDNGKTTLFSPVLDLSGALDATISYWRWYSNHTGSAPNADVFVIDITNDGTTWVNVETIGPSDAYTQGGWFYHEFNVSDFVTPTATVQLRFVASDLGSGSIVEAAIDDFDVIAITCQNVVPCPGDLDGDNDVDLDDLTLLLGDFGCMSGGCTGDIDGDGDTDLDDLVLLLGAYGAVCS